MTDPEQRLCGAPRHRRHAEGRAASGDRLAAEQQQLLRRGAGGTERHVPDPDADHPGRRVQRDLVADHDGEGQDARHRGAAHAGCGTRRGDAHLPDVRCLGRHHRDRRWHAARRGVLLEHRDHPALGGGGHRHLGVQSRGVLPDASARRGSTGTR